MGMDATQKNLDQWKQLFLDTLMSFREEEKKNYLYIFFYETETQAFRI